jgi:capsular polysaccharide export protein
MFIGGRFIGDEGIFFSKNWVSGVEDGTLAAFGSQQPVAAAQPLPAQCRTDEKVELEANKAPITFRLRRTPLPMGRKQRPRVLLLQGPVGSFFSQLLIQLEGGGFDPWQVCFNAGDRFVARHRKRIDFAGDEVEWESWLRAFLAGASIDHVILFGSNRPAHIVARRVAAEMRVHVLSLEEGYIRPGYITVETGGNNAHSPLAARLPSWRLNTKPPDLPLQSYAASFQAMCRQGAAYYAMRTLFSSSRERSLFHRRFRVLREPFLWGRNAWRRFVGRVADFRTIEHLLEHCEGRYFLVPLQVAADGQMGEAARGWSVPRLVTESLGSFAQHAPSGCRLVFKIHPLERGHTDARKLVRKTAEELGIADRVDVIDTGSLGLITRHAAGMITINSTSGLSAIYHGVPLMVIGDALYAHPQLATVARGEPDFKAFWTSRFVADAELRRRYLLWIRSEALVAGDFYAAEGVPHACAGILEKLRSAAVKAQEHAA